MSLNKNYFIFILCLLTVKIGLSQVKQQADSSQVESLNEVVITGQYNPQSVKKSVHNVIVITREQIENQAANNLADLLNFNLNLTILPNSQTGKSTISFFGLDAQYFNILVDNIPLVSDSGLGNNIDLTQINLDDIERIEIVEGAMGVEYGANAVSGVINIITKKSSHNKSHLQASIQEETVGDEYAWFDEGRHIQSFSASHNFNDTWFVRGGFNRNDFAGFKNNRLGKDHYENDSLRGYDWLPKEQITTNALINYKRNNLKAFYKFEYFNETIGFYDAAVRQNIDVINQTRNPSASDKIYKTNRFINNLNLSGNLNSGAYFDVSFSYQQQKRRSNDFTYFIVTEQKTNETDSLKQSSEVFFSRGNISNLVKKDKFNFQMGYETRWIRGFDSDAAGDDTQKDEKHDQTNLAGFVSAEYQFTDKTSLRPGIRYEYNSMFHSKLLGSLSAKHLLNHGLELRLNVGTSYRTPNFEELYYYFVDSNHDVRGNENLTPENGYSLFLNLKKTSWLKNSKLLNSLKLSYINVTDRIEMAIINTLPLQYQYINIDSYKLWGLTTENSIKSNQWVFNLGVTFQGISRVLNEEVNAQNDFLYSYQINTGATYQFEELDTTLSLFFKYNGSQKNYVASGDSDLDGNSLFVQQKTDGYGWLDASIKKNFLNKSIQAAVGARNLLDVTNVNVSNGSTGGTHTSNNSSLLLGYGRSFYIKLLYNLNF